MKKRYPIDLTSVRLRERRNGYVIYFRLPKPKDMGAGRVTQASPARTASPRWKDGIYVAMWVDVRNGVSPLPSSRSEVKPLQGALTG